MAYKVVSPVGAPLNDKASEALAEIGAKLTNAPLLSEEDIIRYASDADAVIVGPTEPYTRKVIHALEKCKVISRMGIGCYNIDLEAATEQGIPVAYIPDASTTEVSDHTMAFLLALSRKLIPVDKAVRSKTWQLGSAEIQKTIVAMFRLSEQTLGLIGLGRIGSAVALKAKAFGMRVIFWDPYVSDELAQASGVERADFNSILRESDFVSLHAAVTEQTYHILGLAQFRMMKPTAYVINTARGGLIDEKALYIALSEGYIAGAGIDVTDPEPPDPENPLLQLDNILVTAHSAYYSETSVRELRDRAVKAVIDALQGKWPGTLANPEVRERDNRRIR